MDKRTEIVWVFGNSGAGKEKFITAACGNKAQEIARAFDWIGKDVIPCNESIDWVEQRKGDGNKEKRKALQDIVIKLVANTNLVILVKGQFLDLVYGRPDRVRRALPGCRHRVIFINTDSQETYERLQFRTWWDPKWNRETVLGWVRDQVGRLKKLDQGFEMITANGGAGKGYAISAFPPILK